MEPVKIKEGVYWVGGIDWSLRDFHGYTTYKGSTYNAYLILDEKITLIDTVKHYLADEMIERISKLTDPSKIDYLISNHVEMDHSGSIPAIMKHCPNAKIITSSPQGAAGLTAHYGKHDYMPVKGGDTLSLGKRSLCFVQTPMLHWPDNMVSYCPEEKILFSNDAFGEHYASTARFDDEADLPEVMAQAKKYYANIVMPYSSQAKSAVSITEGLDIEYIATSHGIVWRSHIKDILDCYKKWSSGETENRAIVVYDSMWHSTELMAHTINEAFGEAGVSSQLFDLKLNHISDIMTEVLTSKYIAVGSPTLNNNLMPNVSAFLTYLKGLSTKEHKAFAFGSYGWSGQSVGQVEELLKGCGYEIMLEKQRLKYIPSKEQLETLAQSVKQAIKQ